MKSGARYANLVKLYDDRQIYSREHGCKSRRTRNGTVMWDSVAETAPVSASHAELDTTSYVR
jgi:hypothetical protein